MDINGKFDHIEDVLIDLHEGQWFGWSDHTNKVYANLVIHNSDYDKPSELSLTNALTTQQSSFNAQEYSRNREAEYPSYATQLDEIYHNGIDSWKAVIQVTKDKYPKPE